jgi:ATP-dependent Clp protease ATP-binding subunit ClpC
VMNLLLQILEEGRLTDSIGRKIDFRNTIIIMTSNLGADLIRKSTEVGFGAKENSLDHKVMTEKIEGSAKKHFKPEFLNRLDGLVVFNTLTKAAYRKVIDLEFNKLKNRLEKKQITLELDDAARDFLVDKGYLPEMGARPLRRVIEQYLEDPLAEKTLLAPSDAKNYLISMKDGAISFSEKDKIDPQVNSETASTPK